jgi:hypothetical protein
MDLLELVVHKEGPDERIKAHSFVQGDAGSSADRGEIGSS